MELYVSSDKRIYVWRSSLRTGTTP